MKLSNYGKMRFVRWGRILVQIGAVGAMGAMVRMGAMGTIVALLLKNFL